MTNRTHSKEKQGKSEVNIAGLPMCPELVDHCAQQIIQIMAEDQEELRTVPPQPVYHETKHKSKNKKCGQGLEMCTKHNYCLQNARAPQPDPEADFSFPSILLIQENPTQVDVRPIKMMRVVDEIDKVIELNLKKHKQAGLAKKKQQEAQKEIQRKKMEKLKENARQKINICPKISIEQKRTKWGHNLYNEEKRKDVQQDRNQENKPKGKKQPTIELKPVGERIKQYKVKERQQQKNIEKESECQHQHLNPNKPVSDKKQDIEKNAEEILRQRKRERYASEEKKKCIQGKIRAIQIQSIEGLKKFKKKPVDPTIQFIVEIPEKVNHKKPKKKKPVQKIEKEQEDPSHRQKNFLRRDMSKSSLSNTHKSNKQKSKTQNSQKNIPDNSQLAEEEGNPIHTQKHPYDNKFYVWNIPIASEDLSVFDLPADPKQKEKAKIKSFRQQVDEYLSRKFHNSMQQQIQESKMNKFNQLVCQKKKQLLEEFNRQQYGQQARSQFAEVFWNEDILFKNHQIANFSYH